MPFFKVIGDRIAITAPEDTKLIKDLSVSIENLQKQVKLYANL